MNTKNHLSHSLPGLKLLTLNRMQVVASETIELPRATAGAWQATAASLSGPAGAVIGSMAGETGHRSSLLHVLEGKVIISIFCHGERVQYQLCL